MTFSIVAADLEAGEWGVATQSKFLAVGAVVPWARAPVGAVATQSFAEASFGVRGLDLMASGLSAQEALDRLLERDDGRDVRQVGIVDGRGGVASWTGSACVPFAASVLGERFACQGNIMANEGVVPSMAAAFEASTGRLASRLVEALRGAQAAGGDGRGQEAAALLVVKEGGGYGGTNDRYIDLRVDHHDEPIEELAKLLGLHHLYFDHARPEDLIDVDAALLEDLSRQLARVGHPRGGGDVLDDLQDWMGRQNLEERWAGRERIDRVVLEYLRDQPSTA